MSLDLSKKELIYYGALAMPLAFAGIPLYIHAPDFYAVEYGISLSSLAFILLALRCFDAVQDPLIGYLSDRYSEYRAMAIRISACLLVMSFGLLFMPLTHSYAIWFAVFMALSTSAFSLLTINLNTLGGMWKRDQHHKTIIAGYREFFGLLGLICAVILPTILALFMSKENSFLVLSGILMIVMIIALTGFEQWHQKHLIQKGDASKKIFSLLKCYALSSRVKQFFILYGISMIASAIPSVLVLFFIRDRLNLEPFAGLFLLSYFLSGAFSIILWNHISKKIGKHKSWLVAMLCAVISFVWAYFLEAGDLYPFLMICILSGGAFGAELVLPASILADHIHYEKNEKSASLYFGLLAFGAKMSLAIAAGFSLTYLDFMGFVAGAENSNDALHALSLTYAIVPCIIKLISTFLLWRILNEINGNINRSAFDV